MYSLHTLKNVQTCTYIFFLKDIFYTTCHGLFNFQHCQKSNKNHRLIQTRTKPTYLMTYEHISWNSSLMISFTIRLVNAIDDNH